MAIMKVFEVLIKGTGKILKSKVVKNTIAVGSLVGVGLIGNGISKIFKAKKKNNQAYAIRDKALSMHKIKLNETSKNIINLGIEEKKSINLIDLFMILAEKIKRLPSMDKIDSKIEIPPIKTADIKKMSKGLDLVLSGVGGSVVGALPGFIFFGASVSTLGLATLGTGVALSIKGGNLSKQSIENIKQAEKLTHQVDEIIKYYNQLDDGSMKLTESIRKVNFLYDEKLNKLQILVDKNNDYMTYSMDETILVKNCFNLTILLNNMCKTTLAKRVNEIEVVNMDEIDFIVEHADKKCKEIKLEIPKKGFA